MIEILEGTHETINYGNPLGLRLFHNVDYEDYPEHWHTAIEIIMPIHEGYNVIVGSKKYCLKEGDILIINPGVLHGLEAPPTGERIILQFSDYLLYSLKEMETLLNVLPPSWWSDPVLLGHYPEEGMKRYEAYLPQIMDEDMKLISEPIDVYGQNIYNGYFYAAARYHAGVGSLEDVVKILLESALISPEALTLVMQAA